MPQGSTACQQGTQPGSDFIELLNLLSTYYGPLPIPVGSKDPFFYGASILVVGGAEEGGRQEINTINR